MLCAPSANSHVQSLDSVLVKFNPIYYRAETVLSESAYTTPSDDVRQIMQDAMNLEREFRAWAADQPAVWLPTKIDRFVNRVSSLPFVCSENIENYFDCELSNRCNHPRARPGHDLTFGSLRRSCVEQLPQNASSDARRGFQVSEEARRLCSTGEAAARRE